MQHFNHAITALAVTLFLTLAANAQTIDQPSAFWTTGVRINQAKPFGLLGITKRMTSRLYQYTGADLGGTERSLTTQTAFRVTSPATWEIYALAGPQVETIQQGASPDETIDYLTASSGALLCYQRNESLAFFASFQYLWSSAPIIHWKFGFGILVPIDLT
jgi:hypothetical protein